LRKLDFIHHHVHSAYSLLEGALPIAKLLDLAIADDQPAIGLADTANLFGALEFSQKAINKGIQPIIGCELAIEFDDEDDLTKAFAFAKRSIVLKAINKRGFSNLSALVSKAYLDGCNDKVAISLDWLNGDSSEGLICLSGGPEGAVDPLFSSGLEGHATDRLKKLHEIFKDRFYIELQRHNFGNEKLVEPQLIDFAYQNSVPLVATNEPYFPFKKDFEAHDALLSIAGSTVLAQTERRKLSDQHYFKTREQMQKLFNDLPEALDNSIEIAKRISFYANTHPPILPKFAAAPDLDEDSAVEAEAKELSAQAHAGLKERMKTLELAEGLTQKDYFDRLDFELGVIGDMKFPGYFLIVADFIKWTKQQNIPVGPGRGSGAGSLVAYALTITDLDPLRYNLLFERFLNPDRVSMPDFDIDFCQDRREEVIKYVQNKYGFEQVAQIITFGSLQARAALRDVGRVLQMPYSQVDRICKLVPSNPADPVTLAQAIAGEVKLQEMRDEDEIVAELLEIAQSLEGLYRHASTHAAGIVIGDRPLQELVPLYRDSRSTMPVTQYSLKWVEPAGLVKFDFLGLKTLTVIEKAVQMIRKTDDENFAIQNIPIDDKDTYLLYQRAETLGVFQVESQGMRRALVDLLPDRFEDVIALVALYRPGPMDNIGSFCARKHGKEDMSILHPDMEPILFETYGIIVYQEQVMQIAQTLSGYSLGEADLLRRAMGKKVKAEMDAQRSRFVEGALKKGIASSKANKIFDLLAKFANYGFNKSHAAAYALVSYQTAYLKAHYPHEFLAASMTLEMSNTDKLYDFKLDADRLKIEIFPPSINHSEVAFAVKDEKIYYSLCALKGVGEQVVEHIVEIRGDKPFVDFGDFASRIDPKSVNKRALETMINAGVFDEIVPERHLALLVIDAIIATAQRTSSDKKNGIVDMFATDAPVPIALPTGTKGWSEEEKLEREFKAIGFHLSGHPLDQFIELFEKLRVQRWVDFEKSVGEGAKAGRLAGTIASRMDRKTRKGKAMTIVSFSDTSGGFECVGFSEQITAFGEYLEVGKSVILEVEAEQRAEGIGLRMLKVSPIAKEVEKTGKQLTIFTNNKQCLAPIKSLLVQGGEGEVSFVIIRDAGAREYEISLNGKYRLTPDLTSGIKALSGVVDASLS